MQINRDNYLNLNQLIARRKNSMIKVINILDFLLNPGSLDY
jgi:hypothetical protein